MISNLGTHLARVRQLRTKLDELLVDVQYLSSGGGTIYYAADFSELYAYLHESEKPFGVDINIRDENEQDRKYELNVANQHRLGLAHLFHTLTSTVYMLPPHTMELWSFVRSQTEGDNSVSDLKARALKEVNSLDEPTRSMLGSLSKSSVLSADEKKLLLDLIKGEFESICARVTSFVELDQRGNALRNLLDEKDLACDVNELLRAQGMAAEQLPQPLLQEELDVYEAISDKDYAKFFDARALVFLRNINRLLAQKRAKLVLITRDKSIPAAAEKLQNKAEFGWPNTRHHVRGIETVFLDLVLKGMSHERGRDKIDWIRGSDELLRDCEQAIHDLTRTAADSRRDALEKQVQKLAGLWNERTNLQLSLSLSKDTKLRQKFEQNFQKLGDADIPADEAKRLKLLENLWTFVTTERYQNLAEDSVTDLWREMHAETFNLVLQGEDQEHLRNALSEHLSGLSAFRLPAIRFSEKYRKRLDLLQSFNKRPAKLTQNRVFLSTVFEVTSDASEPDDFLFKAFIHGMLEQWPQAISRAELSREMLRSRGLMASESNFFLSFAKRSFGKLEKDPRQEKDAYIGANRNILEAISESGPDPRFLHEQASLSMIFHELAQPVGETTPSELGREFFADAEKPVDLKSAIALLSQALEEERRITPKNEDDRRLTTDILNLLVYAQVLNDEPDFEVAEQYLAEIDQELQQLTQHKEQISQSLKGRIDDTRAMVRARRSFVLKNLGDLRQSLDELNSLRLLKPLSAPQRKLIEEHSVLVGSWILALEQGKSNG